MAKLEDLLPNELRERLAAAPARQRVRVWRSECLHGIDAMRHNSMEEAALREHNAAERAVTDWLRTALESGEVIATGWPAGDIGGKPATIPPDTWRMLAYDWRTNAAVSLATRKVVFEGLDFERRQAEPPPVSHTASAGPDPHVVADEFDRAGRRPNRREFRAACAGAKFAVTDDCYKRRFGSLKPHERRKARGD